jgi:hypothetical protein
MGGGGGGVRVASLVRGVVWVGGRGRVSRRCERGGVCRGKAQRVPLISESFCFVGFLKRKRTQNAPLRELRAHLKPHLLHGAPPLLPARVVRPHQLDEEELQRSLGHRRPGRRHILRTTSSNSLSPLQPEGAKHAVYNTSAVSPSRPSPSLSLEHSVGGGAAEGARLVKRRGEHSLVFFCG